MQVKCTLLCGAAFAVLFAAGLSEEAQAATRRHHHAAAVPSALEQKLESLTDTVSDLETRLNHTQAEADAAKADAASARAEAADAQTQLASQIQTLPAQVDSSVATHMPKPPGGVKVTLGGFVAAETIYRTRQNVADVGTNYAKIPYLNSPLAHLNELRGTARQSRFSALIQGDISPTTHAAFYGEFDFLGAAQTANSNESNSYQPRLRQGYATVDWDRLGLHLLAGQAWSLATMTSHGITPRSEVIPPTIDAQFVPGFVWARQPQIRLVKDFANRQVWLGVSLENPQTTIAGIESGTTATASGVTANTGNAGIFLLNDQVTYSYNRFPDVIGKAVFEPLIRGKQPLHLEVFGIWRDYYDRVTYAAGNALGVPIGINNVDTSGGGVGGGATLNVVPKRLDIQGSFLTGTGIGRYGTGQLPDTVVAANGSLQPIPETMFLVGGTLHAAPTLDIYLMYGQEREKAAALATIGGELFGYGNPAVSNATLAACAIEGAACTPDTREIDQITAGFWDKAYTGKFGSVQIGVQYSHTNLTAFSSVGGVTPKTNDDMVFTSFRYYPGF